MGLSRGLSLKFFTREARRPARGGKPSAAVCRQASLSENAALGLGQLALPASRPCRAPRGLLAALRGKAVGTSAAHIRRAAVRGLGTFTWGFLRHSPASVLARGENRGDARRVSVVWPCYGRGEARGKAVGKPMLLGSREMGGICQRMSMTFVRRRVCPSASSAKPLKSGPFVGFVLKKSSPKSM